MPWYCNFFMCLNTVLFSLFFTFAFVLSTSTNIGNSGEDFNLDSHSISSSQHDEEQTSGLFMHWSNEQNPTFHNAGDPDTDICVLLSQCFSIYAPDPNTFPENPLQYCHFSLPFILNILDTGFYFDGPRVVGFISASFSNQIGFSSINLSDVCVRKEERGKGIAKTMIPQFIKSVKEKRISAEVERVYVGLAVDFKTESAVNAFSLYAKLGFNRWWEPCHHISLFDYEKLEYQWIMANPPLSDQGSYYYPPTMHFPMEEVILRGKSALNEMIYDQDDNVLNLFCMVMSHGEDDFESIGRRIKETIETETQS